MSREAAAGGTAKGAQKLVSLPKGYLSPGGFSKPSDQNDLLFVIRTEITLPRSVLF